MNTKKHKRTKRYYHFSIADYSKLLGLSENTLRQYSSDGKVNLRNLESVFEFWLSRRAAR